MASHLDKHFVSHGLAVRERPVAVVERGSDVAQIVVVDPRENLVCRENRS